MFFPCKAIFLPCKDISIHLSDSLGSHGQHRGAQSAEARKVKRLLQVQRNKNSDCKLPEWSSPSYREKNVLNSEQEDERSRSYREENQHPVPRPTHPRGLAQTNPRRDPTLGIMQGKPSFETELAQKTHRSLPGPRSSPFPVTLLTWPLFPLTLKELPKPVNEGENT